MKFTNKRKRRKDLEAVVSKRLVPDEEIVELVVRGVERALESRTKDLSEIRTQADIRTASG